MNVDYVTDKDTDMFPHPGSWITILSSGSWCTNRSRWTLEKDEPSTDDAPELEVC